MVYDCSLDNVLVFLCLRRNYFILSLMLGQTGQKDAGTEWQGVALVHPCLAYLVASIKVRDGRRDQDQ